MSKTVYTRKPTLGFYITYGEEEGQILVCQECGFGDDPMAVLLTHDEAEELSMALMSVVRGEAKNNG